MSRSQFHATTLEEAKLLFDCGLLTVAGYVYFIIKIQRKDGWDMRVNPSDFCKQYGIKKRTFYDAISKLHCYPELRFEWRTTGDIIMKFHEAKPNKSPEAPPEVDSSLCDTYPHSQQAELVQNLAQQCGILHSSAESCTAVQNLAQEIPGMQSHHESHSATDINQIIIKSTHTQDPPTTPCVCVEDLENREEEEEFSRGTASNEADLVTQADSCSDLKNQDRATNEPTYQKGTIPAAPSTLSNKKYNSKSTGSWQCPQPELRDQFVEYRANQMLLTRYAGAPDMATAILAAEGWVDKDHDRADKAFDKFLRDRVEKEQSKLEQDAVLERCRKMQEPVEPLTPETERLIADMRAKLAAAALKR